MDDFQINEENLWRLESPGDSGWEMSPRAGAAKKYFIVSADCHANEPPDLWATRIEPEYRDRVPHVETDENGVQWRVSEGHRPDRLRISSFEGEDQLRAQAGADIDKRILDNKEDGIDVELIFPNKGLGMWATPDPVFATAQCRVWKIGRASCRERV